MKMQVDVVLAASPLMTVGENSKTFSGDRNPKNYTLFLSLS